MKAFFNTPLEQLVLDGWRSISNAYRNAFYAVMLVSLMAFGFEMTNLTIHHDDVHQLFIEGSRFGYSLGRFGLGWLHYYTQSTYIMPFLQLLQGIVLMAAYGLAVAHLWGLRRTADITVVAAIVCAFPFMAQIYQYNTAMATYPLAHLLAATALIVSIRATPISIVLAAVLYVAAFSIYQSVVANAATLFLLWALVRLVFANQGDSFFSRSTAKSTLAVLLAVSMGGLSYIAAVLLLRIDLTTYQGVEEAFHLRDGIDLPRAVGEVLDGSRSFYRWPESFFPGYLKNLQLMFIMATVAICAWRPVGIKAKGTALFILGLSLFAPRLLQLLHPSGAYHNLTLTAYALVVAACVMTVMRAGGAAVRNFSLLLCVVLLGGYIHQSNWISTLNHLNTQAHYSTLTQILARLRALPDRGWDGKVAVVVGEYEMPWAHPYRKATGVTKDFISPMHMQKLAQLMRDEMKFLPVEEAPHGVREFAANLPHWPHPNSMGIVDGVAVIVLSRTTAGEVRERSD